MMDVVKLAMESAPRRSLQLGARIGSRHGPAAAQPAPEPGSQREMSSAATLVTGQTV